MLSVKRKADREEMARLLVSVVEAAGSKAAQDVRGSKEIVVHIEAPRQLRLAISLDGSATWRNGGFVLSWHIAAPYTTRLASAFGQGINEFHRQKSTDFAPNFDALCALLGRRLRQAADGSAFLPD